MWSKQTFKDLDPGLQDAAVQLVENLDSSYASAMKAYSPDPYAYIRDNFIVPMGNLNDSDKQKLQSGIAELFKLDAGNLSQNNQKEIEKYISTIAALLEKTPSEIRVMLGFDIQDELDRYKEALAKAKHQLGGTGMTTGVSKPIMPQAVNWMISGVKMSQQRKTGFYGRPLLLVLPMHRKQWRLIRKPGKKRMP